jgi:hypothetical protein
MQNELVRVLRIRRMKLSLYNIRKLCNSCTDLHSAYSLNTPLLGASKTSVMFRPFLPDMQL